MSYNPKSKIQNPKWSPGGLYWRLIVSYFLVTLVAVLTIEVATVLLPLIQEYRQVSSAVPLDQQLERAEAPSVAPYLQGAGPDRARLESAVLIPMLYRLDSAAPSAGTLAAVLDRHGQAVAAVSCDWVRTPARAAGQCATLAAVAITDALGGVALQKGIQTALAGDGRTTAAAAGRQGGTWDIIVPIHGADGGIVGVLLTVLQGPVAFRVQFTADRGGLTPLGDIVQTFLSRLQPAGLAFLLLATGIGTLTGVLISRNLTRRLRHITQAADAWSRGEFEVVVPDRTRDEVGQLARDLNRMAAQIRALLTTRQELAVVEERNRLARDLHDSVKQQVFAGALLVRAAATLLPRDPAAAQRHLAEAEALAEQVQQELVALIGALRPAALADKGLSAVLQEYVADWARRMGIAAEVRVAGAQATPLDIEEALFRVAQEALANAARHSGTPAVVVRLAWTGTQVNLTVEDSGHGFDLPGAEGRGQGLANMRERVAALGGRLTISSSPVGTSVVARVPLAAAPPAPPAVAAEVAR